MTSTSHQPGKPPANRIPRPWRVTHASGRMQPLVAFNLVHARQMAEELAPDDPITRLAPEGDW
jgi:hypothetical protein